MTSFFRHILFYILFGLLLIPASFPQDSSPEKPIQRDLDSLQAVLFTDTIPYVQKIGLCNRILEEARVTNDPKSECWALMNLSVCYYKLNAYKTSQSYARESWDLAQSLDDPLFKARSGLLFGNLFFEMEEHARAIPYFESALEYFDEIDNYNVKCSILNGLGTSLDEEGRTEEGIMHLRRSLAIADSSGSPFFKAISLINLGSILLESKGEIAEAKSYFLEAVDLSRAAANLEAEATGISSVGACFLREGDLKLAEEYYLKSNEIAEHAGLSVILRRNANNLTEIYRRTGRLEEAIEAQAKYIQLSDSIKSEKALLQTNELQEIFEVEKREKELKAREAEIALLEEERHSARLRNYLIFGAFGVVLMGGMIVFFKYRSDMRKNRQMQDMKAELMESELKRKELEQQRLSAELKGKNQDLTDFAIDITRKYEFTREVLQRLRQLKATKSPERSREMLKDLIIYTMGQQNIDESLKVFQENIEKVNHEFFERIDARFPDLTVSEKQLCGLVRLRLTNKEIAVIRSISPKAAKVNRYRLRKKLGIEPEEDLYQFLLEV